ncbi:unnamed protein product [Anisakis simplex]|uniref:Poly(A)-specific ribonuclease n=1 Tax=Anisakis simplex TaxID=6269 RepID=A0A0M3JZR4_ANISI|nr:unnamed protein product [Anisakis simplex]
MMYPCQNVCFLLFLTTTLQLCIVRFGSTAPIAQSGFATRDDCISEYPNEQQPYRPEGSYYPQNYPQSYSRNQWGGGGSYSGNRWNGGNQWNWGGGWNNPYLPPSQSSYQPYQPATSTSKPASVFDTPFFQQGSSWSKWSNGKNVTNWWDYGNLGQAGNQVNSGLSRLNDVVSNVETMVHCIEVNNTTPECKKRQEEEARRHRRPPVGPPPPGARPASPSAPPANHPDASGSSPNSPPGDPQGKHPPGNAVIDSVGVHHLANASHEDPSNTPSSIPPDEHPSLAATSSDHSSDLTSVAKDVAPKNETASDKLSDGTPSDPPSSPHPDVKRDLENESKEKAGEVDESIRQATINKLHQTNTTELVTTAESNESVDNKVKPSENDISTTETVQMDEGRVEQLEKQSTISYAVLFVMISLSSSTSFDEAKAIQDTLETILDSLKAENTTLEKKPFSAQVIKSFNNVLIFLVPHFNIKNTSFKKQRTKYLSSWRSTRCKKVSQWRRRLAGNALAPGPLACWNSIKEKRQYFNKPIDRLPGRRENLPRAIERLPLGRSDERPIAIFASQNDIKSSQEKTAQSQIPLVLFI